MFVSCGILLLCLSCVRTNNINEDLSSRADDFYSRYSAWPSMHNAARLVRFRRETQVPTQTHELVADGVVSEGGVIDTKANLTTVGTTPVTSPAGSNFSPPENVPKEVKTVSATPETKDKTVNATESNANITQASPVAPISINNNQTNGNETVADKSTVRSLDLNDPAVLKRGFIVFGGFAVIAGIYFIFYRRNRKNNPTSNALSSSEANQFRYGMLQSEDRRDNLELSRVPLTMESDDDEEEDMEIFDLEQKKKSMSYVNLETNDVDVVLSSQNNAEDKDNLLLDIEDANTDMLINWSSNGSKSIL